MSPNRNILFECQNLTLVNGTGIATYARNLAKEAGNLGYGASGLIGVKGSVGLKNAMLEEISLFDARKTSISYKQWVIDSLRWLHADILGVEPKKHNRSGIVVNSERLSKGFESLYLVQNLVERARQHFMRYGTPLELRMNQKFSALHLTQAIPMIAKQGPTICTIHDIIPLRLPSTTLDNKRYFFDMVKAMTRKADHIVTVSENSKRDLIEFFGVDPERITNTYQSVDIEESISLLQPVDLAEDLRNMFDLEYQGYFLFVGAIEPKKNVSTLIESYATSGCKLPLILAGNLGWQYETDVQKMSDERFVSFNVSEKSIKKYKAVQHLSYLPRSHLLRLIKGAKALIFPSLYEGFGLPVLEAMALGTPVITSAASSLPEVTGDAALLVNPNDVIEISNAIKRINGDAELRAELSEKGIARARLFSAEIYQDRLRDLYKRVL